MDAIIGLDLQTTAPERGNQVGYGLALDANVGTENVIADFKRARDHLEPLRVKQYGQRAPEFAHIHNHLASFFVSTHPSSVFYVSCT